MIYGEPPFRPADAQVFRNRADASPGVEDWSFLTPLKATARPLVLIGGAELRRQMPVPRCEQPIRLDGPGKHRQGIRATAFGWRTQLLPQVETTTALIAWLTSFYECVGDPFCGYGNTGRIFTHYGRSAVLSDLNPRCIGYIALRAPSWVR